MNTSENNLEHILDKFDEYMKKYLEEEKFQYTNMQLLFNQETDQIGEGGFGKIYKGKLGDQKVAIKEIPITKFQEDPEMLEFIIRSIKYGSRLKNKDHLLFPIYAYKYLNKSIVFVSELFDEDLTKYITRVDQSELPLEEKNNYKIKAIHEILISMKEAHNNDIVIRDVSPKNILLKTNGFDIKKTVLNDLDFIGYRTDKILKDTEFTKSINLGNITTRSIMKEYTFTTIKYAHDQLVYFNPEFTNNIRTDLYALGWIIGTMFGMKFNILGTESSFKNRNDLRKTKLTKFPKGLEKVFVHATNNNLNEGYQNTEEFIEDIETIIDGKIPKKAYLKKSWKNRKGRLTKIIKRTMAGIGLTTLLLAGTYFYNKHQTELEAYNNSAVAILDQIQKTQKIPDLTTRKELLRRIAKEHRKPFMKYAEPLIEEGRIPLGCNEPNSAPNTTANWSGRYDSFIIDLKELSKIDPYYKELYIRSITASKLRKSPVGLHNMEFSSRSILGRFYGEISNLDPDNEDPPLAGRLAMMWYNKEIGTFVIPNSINRIEAESLIKFLPLLSELPRHYSPEEFIQKPLNNFKQYEELSHFKPNYWNENKISVKDYLLTILNATNKGLKILTQDNQLFSAAAPSKNGIIEYVRSTSAGNSVSDQLAAIYGATYFLNTLEDILNNKKEFNSYSDKLQLSDSEKIIIQKQKKDIILQIQKLFNYVIETTPKNAKFPLQFFDQDKQIGKPDLLTAAYLVVIIDKSQKLNLNLGDEILFNKTMINILSPENYVYKPEHMREENELLYGPFKNISLSYLPLGTYGKVLGLIAPILEK